mmetsp:Transcript_25962/g.60609  ORF Transcript_25962/g.60609 Transcript_25962/m.60609 type:complete len:200 (-) Transcript_25962:1281-1880(-)
MAADPCSRLGVYPRGENWAAAHPSLALAQVQPYTGDIADPLRVGYEEGGKGASTVIPGLACPRCAPCNASCDLAYTPSMNPASEKLPPASLVAADAPARGSAACAPAPPATTIARNSQRNSSLSVGDSWRHSWACKPLVLYMHAPPVSEVDLSNLSFLKTRTWQAFPVALALPRPSPRKLHVDNEGVRAAALSVESGAR